MVIDSTGALRAGSALGAFSVNPGGGILVHAVALNALTLGAVVRGLTEFKLETRSDLRPFYVQRSLVSSPPCLTRRGSTLSPSPTWTRALVWLSGGRWCETMLLV